ncbi:hypothetical protein BJX63DRAFT_386331 [Aspergillus granulosus]|uniref:Uncharacterized protein n=1 Tax=Aspergillus granulosus TaxID=176169 RepID=A0ABR4HNX0_9EURO
MEAYTNVVDYLATAIAVNLPATQDMSRWYSKPFQDCVPTVTTISDAAIQKNQQKANIQKGTMEHVYEKNWLEGFWTWLMEAEGTGGGGWTCKQFTDLFFPCDSNKLQSVYDGIAGNTYWDFIGITAELNKNMKGSMGGDYGAEVVRRTKNVRRTIEPMAPWRSIRKVLGKQKDVLDDLVLGCDIWTSDYIHGPLDATNNRIYNAIYSINQDLAAKYRQWVITTRLGQMMEVTKTQV